MGQQTTKVVGDPAAAELGNTQRCIASGDRAEMGRSRVARQASEGNWEIYDPTTGELVPADDTDRLIELFEVLHGLEGEIRTAKIEAQRALAAKTSGPGRTRHLEGRRRKVKVEMPPPSWDQTKLRSAWDAFPAVRDQYMRIDSLAVRRREFDKLRNATAPKSLQAFREILLSAERQSGGNPRITIEE